MVVPKAEKIDDIAPVMGLRCLRRQLPSASTIVVTALISTVMMP